MAFPSGPNQNESPWSEGPLCGLRPQMVETQAQMPFEQYATQPSTTPNQSFITLEIPAPLRDENQTNPWTGPQVTMPYQFAPPPMPFNQQYQQGSNLVQEQQQQFFYQEPQQQQQQQQQNSLLEQSYGFHVFGSWPNENMSSEGAQLQPCFDMSYGQPARHDRFQYNNQQRNHQRKPRHRKPRRRHERRMAKFSKSDHQKPILKAKQDYSTNEAKQSHPTNDEVVSQDDECKLSQIVESEDGQSSHSGQSDAAVHGGSERIDSQQLRCVPAVFGFACRACDVFLLDSPTRREHIESESHKEKFLAFTGQEQMNASESKGPSSPVIVNIENDDQCSLDDLDDRLEIVSVGEQEESFDGSS